MDDLCILEYVAGENEISLRYGDGTVTSGLSSLMHGEIILSRVGYTTLGTRKRFFMSSRSIQNAFTSLV